MEILSMLISAALFGVFLYFFIKWSYKREKEMTERKARVIGECIAEAIISSVEDLKK